MNKILKNAWFLIAFGLTIVFLTAQKSDKLYGWTNPDLRGRYVYQGDAFGYFSFLPQYIIYRNQPGYSYLDSIGQQNDILLKENMIYYSDSLKHRVNKFYIGTALVQSPFYLTNYLIQKNTNGKTDGYSFSYEWAVFIGAMFYLFIGIIGLVLLFDLFQINRIWSYLAVLTVYYGTNLTYYSITEFMLSHMYAYTALVWFLYFMKKWTLNNKFQTLLASVSCFSLLVLIRPVDGIILLIIPFLFESFYQFKSRLNAFFSLKNCPKWLLVGLTGFGLFSIQLLSNYYQYGKISFYPYEKEGFDYLFSPQFKNVLFSYRKGFFIYTPVMLLIFPSLFFIIRSKKYVGIGAAFVTLAIFWIISSWWCWYYGGSLGMRALVDFYPFFLLVIFGAFQLVKWPVKIIYSILIGIGSYMNSVYEYQYLHNILHYAEMNRETFLHVFMKKDFRLEWYPHIYLEKQAFLIKGKTKSIQTYRYQAQKNQFSSNNATIPTVIDHSFTWRTTLHPDSTTINALTIDGQQTITNPADLNNATIIYKKGNDTLDQHILYFGNEAEQLNKQETFHVEYQNKQNAGADSLIIQFVEQGGKRKLSNLVIKLYQLEK